MAITRIASIVFTTMLLLPAAGRAQAPADFSGTWQMAADRSESAHQAVPIGPVTLVVTQTDSEISIETRRKASKGKTETEVLTYKLDGSETTVSGKDGTPIKSKAHWEGNKLVTNTARNVQGSTVTTLNVHSLDPTGKELTILRTLTVQHGYQFEGAKSYGTGTDVFLKKTTASK